MQITVNLRNNFLPALKKKGWTLEVFAENCSLTKAGLINIFNNNDTKLSTLLTMCHVAEIPIESIFTQESPSTVNEPIGSYSNSPDNKYLQCLENNNHLTTRVRQLEAELGALKKESGETSIRTR